MIKEIVSLLIGKAHAQELIPCEDGSWADPLIGCAQTPSAIVSSQSEILTIIIKVASGLAVFAVTVSIAVLIYGGIVYAMSMGNGEKIKTAKNIIFWSLFGLVVALLAKYIVTAVLTLLGN